MAKVISDEILKLKIVINGDEAQKRVLDLELANKRLGITLKDLQQKQQVLSRQRKKDSDEYKDNQRAIDTLTKAMSNNRKEIDNEVRSMNIMSLTMEQLKRRASELQFQLNHMNPNSAEYTQASTQLGELNGRMTQLRTGANASSLSIQNLAGKFNHYSGIVAGALAVMAGVALSVKSTIDLNNKLADAQTTVAKTTGMTNEEVKELMRTYSDFDTRTSKMDLLKISEVGGRLGVPKAEIAQFTQEVDKMYVALGDSFEGGVEQVANQMGKIKNLFRETKDLDIPTAFNQIGSSLNELGANGAASEANIADFTLRVGALPDNLKPSIAETLALGAAFEESGIDAERSGTAYSSFVRMAAKESAKFAEVMNITQKEVEELINKDPMQFFLKFAEGAKGLDTTEMAKMLDYLKLNDQYVISILGAASENTDRFRKTIALSNDALQEATSLTEEFNKVNNNSAAIYNKVQKSIIGAFTSDTVAKFLNSVISGFGKLIGAVDDSEGVVSMFGSALYVVIKILAVAVVSIFSFNTAISLSTLLTTGLTEKTVLFNIVQKTRSVLTAAQTIIQSLWNTSIGVGATVLGLFTNNTKLQTIAQTRLNAVTSANAIGAMISLIITAVAVYKIFIQTTDYAADSKKRLKVAFLESAESVAKERSELDKLYKAATNAAAGKDAQRKAAEKLQELYPKMFANISTEVIMNGKAEKSYLTLRDAILSAAKAKAAQGEIDRRAAEDLKEDMELQEKFDSAIERYRKPEKQTIRGVGSGGLMGGGQSDLYLDEKDSKELAKKQAYAAFQEMKAKAKSRKERDAYLFKLVEKEEKKGAVAGGKDPYNTNVGGTEDKADKAPRKTDAQRAAGSLAKKFESEKEAMLKNGETAKALAIQLEIDRQNAIADLETDWYTREYLQIKADGLAVVAELEKKLITDEEFKKLNLIISKTKGSERAKFETIREQWMDNNAVIEDLKLKAEETTFIKIQTLNEKLFKENLKKEQEDLQAKIEANQNAVNEALANNSNVDQLKNFLKSLGYSDEALEAIKSWNEGKQEVEKYYQQKSLDEQIRFLRVKVEVLKALMIADPTSFGPAQIKLIQDFANELNKLEAAKNGLVNGKTNEGPNFSSLKQFGADNADLLGMNREQWDAMFASTTDLATNINKVAAALQVAQNMFAQYSAFVQANEQAMLRRMEASSERKQRRLKTELLNGQINQETYKKLTIANEIQLEKKKAELALKSAKRERAMNIASAITGTAVAVVGALGNKPWTPFNIVLASLVGAMGALQLGTILSQPLPEATGAEDGLYPVMRKQDGKVFNSRKRKLVSGMYNEPTLLVGEGGRNYPEMVIDGRTMKRLKPTTVQTLTSEVAQARGFENGMYKENATSSGSDEMMIMIVNALNENTAVMREIKDYGIVGVFDTGPRTGKNLKKSLKSFETLENNSKH
ncbi:phage tail tape measure protein [Chryseobacterium sp. MP_3.2]|uniref:phage tail tape measure protein n=1 Tax=Chryseobacterium sp. MP_3.2 TaxID=3071712 RepID=UPI002E15AE0A